MDHFIDSGPDAIGERRRRMRAELDALRIEERPREKRDDREGVAEDPGGRWRADRRPDVVTTLPEKASRGR